MAMIPAPATSSPAATPPAPFGGFGPRMVSFSSPDAANPTGGQTLDALMARQKALQASQAQPDPTSLASPWLGLSNLVGKVNTAVGLDQAKTQEALGRQQLAQAMNQRDPTTGELTPDAQATVMRLAPTVGEDLYKTSLERRAQLEQIKAQQETWAPDPNHPGQLISSQGNVKNVTGVPHPTTDAERQAFHLRPEDPFYTDENGIPQPIGPKGEVEYRESELQSAKLDVQNNEAAQKHLNEALDYLNTGINTGMLTGGKKLLSNVPGIGGLVDKDTVDRTTQYNDIFNDPAMQSAMRAGMVGIPADDIATFMRTMTSPANSIDDKRKAVNDMRDRMTMIHDRQVSHLQYAITGHPDTSPLPQQTQKPPTLTPAQQQQAVADARTAIGLHPEKRAEFLKRLRDNGITVPGDL
jgi:hypothetical protein